MANLRVGTQSCHCSLDSHEAKLIALTGGPGAGKTAVLFSPRRWALELIRPELPECCHSHLLPGEAVSAAAKGGGQ